MFVVEEVDLPLEMLLTVAVAPKWRPLCELSIVKACLWRFLHPRTLTL